MRSGALVLLSLVGVVRTGGLLGLDGVRLDGLFFWSRGK